MLAARRGHARAHHDFAAAEIIDALEPAGGREFAGSTVVKLRSIERLFLLPLLVGAGIALRGRSTAADEDAAIGQQRRSGVVAWLSHAAGRNELAARGIEQ